MPPIGAAMGLTAARYRFVVFLLWMPAVHCWGAADSSSWSVTYTSTSVCASEGSTVEMSCFYKYPSTTLKIVRIMWFRGHQTDHLDLREDPQYSKRVRYRHGNNNCTMTMRNVTRSDSAEYSFRIITEEAWGKFTGSPGVTLTVTDLQTQTRPKPECVSRCRLPDHVSYVWYTNGEKIPGEPSINDRYSYSCAVDGHEDFASPPKCEYIPGSHHAEAHRVDNGTTD